MTRPGVPESVSPRGGIGRKTLNKSARQRGVLPFDRPGCYFDELLMALGIAAAQDDLAGMAELVERIPPRTAPDGTAESEDHENDRVGDEDWDAVGDVFDDLSFGRWL